eukprot:scaffold30636_cov129-Isochrysis_galbana.AAC.4
MVVWAVGRRACRSFSISSRPSQLEAPYYPPQGLKMPTRQHPHPLACCLSLRGVCLSTVLAAHKLGICRGPWCGGSAWAWVLCPGGSRLSARSSSARVYTGLSASECSRRGARRCPAQA